MPADTPVTIPVDEPAPAMALLLLSHAPPAVVSLRYMVAPTHTGLVPVIPVNGLTVTVTVFRQPVASA